jgi:hypothetical protein
MAQQATPQAPVKKGKSPWAWVGIAAGGCALLLCCISSILGILCVTSADFKEGFEESYCESWEEQGYEPDEDPFGICD